MSEAPDKEAKTEEATPRRVDEALEKGNIPVSREAGLLASIIGIAIVVQMLPFLFSGNAAFVLLMLFDKPGELRLENTEDAVAILKAVGLEIAPIVLAPMLVMMALSVTASVLQNPPGIKYDRIKPQFSRVSPGKGFQRIFGAAGFVEFLKALFKFALLLVVIVVFFNGHKTELVDALQINPRDVPGAIVRQMTELTLTVAGYMLILVGVDVVWSRFKWHADLRMSKQEIKDEQKQSEGDPMVKARQCSLARDRIRRRMMAAVPRATVVIANPTHYAVALRYVQGEAPAPLVIAKGLDHLALRIRAIAEANDIPVIEDRALARSLYDAVVPDRPIPPEFYKAIAEIVLFLMTKNAKPTVAPAQFDPPAPRPLLSG